MQIINWWGGQTGIDQVALDFAIDHYYQHDGFCATRRKAEDGVIPPFYNLTELPDSKYKERTKMNVFRFDGALIVFKNEMYPQNFFYP